MYVRCSVYLICKLCIVEGFVDKKFLVLQYRLLWFMIRLLDFLFLTRQEICENDGLERVYWRKVYCLNDYIGNFWWILYYIRWPLDQLLSSSVELVSLGHCYLMKLFELTNLFCCWTRTVLCTWLYIMHQIHSSPQNKFLVWLFRCFLKWIKCSLTI